MSDCSQGVKGTDKFICLKNILWTLDKTSCSMPFVRCNIYSLHRSMKILLNTACSNCLFLETRHPVNTIFNLWLTSVCNEVIVLVSVCDLPKFPAIFCACRPSFSCQSTSPSARRSECSLRPDLKTSTHPRSKYNTCTSTDTHRHIC